MMLINPLHCAQVHGGVLSKGVTAELGWCHGRAVVLKVQKGDMRGPMEADVRNLRRLAAFVGDTLPFSPLPVRPCSWGPGFRVGLGPAWPCLQHCCNAAAAFHAVPICTAASEDVLQGLAHVHASMQLVHQTEQSCAQAPPRRRARSLCIPSQPVRKCVATAANMPRGGGGLAASTPYFYRGT